MISKQISIKTASGSKLFKVSQSGNDFFIMKYNNSILGSWTDIGRSRNFEDALSIVRAYASSKYGSIYNVRID